MGIQNLVQLEISQMSKIELVGYELGRTHLIYLIFSFKGRQVHIHYNMTEHHELAAPFCDVLRVELEKKGLLDAKDMNWYIDLHAYITKHSSKLILGLKNEYPESFIQNPLFRIHPKV